ncbi:hypothetical protein LSAT2_000379 [Lamellibrachia satsuma]|nr:hypothetical protein LSAT2_000379 [Lamellibrachia satsuma]
MGHVIICCARATAGAFVTARSELVHACGATPTIAARSTSTATRPVTPALQMTPAPIARRTDWITDDTWEAIEARRETKMKLNKEADDTRKKKLQQEYQERNKTVKKKTKRDKKTYVEKLANEAEIAARQNNSRELYKITRQLAGKNKSTSRPIRDKQGNLLTKESLQLQRWKEYFQDILNRPPPD